MFHELSLTLPRLKSYKKASSEPVNSDDVNFEGSLLEIYTEFVCFYARAIYFLKRHRHGRLSCFSYMFSVTKLKQ